MKVILEIKIDVRNWNIAHKKCSDSDRKKELDRLGLDVMSALSDRCGIYLSSMELTAKIEE